MGKLVEGGQFLLDRLPVIASLGVGVIGVEILLELVVESAGIGEVHAAIVASLPHPPEQLVLIFLAEAVDGFPHFEMAAFLQAVLDHVVEGRAHDGGIGGNRADVLEGDQAFRGKLRRGGRRRPPGMARWTLMAP